MTRKFRLTAAFFFFALASMQAFAVGRLTMGVKGGLNSANLRVESETTISTYQTRSGFAWGGFISYRISNLFSVQVEALDSPKGTRILPGFSGTGDDISLMYEYTEVPVLIKLAQGFGSKFVPSLYAGPYWAKLREAKIRTRGEFDDITEDLTDQRSTDFGLIFGASLSYSLGPVALIGDVRYGLGLLDVDRGAGSSLKHRVLSIMAGIGI
ncbi:MAG: hypothetical protein A2W03_04545 [Candidatus Aminicenantes bacterium RBG_16_63_16]|nr:MAG: hypothetical protein A2W03_04545 [Candidatus Aminicenantes bacterium RBG_16_63_16]